MCRLGFFRFPQRLHTKNVLNDGFGYVYFIRYGGTNAYKVGRSVNPIVRLSQLKKDAQCEDITLSFCVRSRNYKRTESLIQDSIRCRRLGGEWFDLSPFERYLHGVE